ncbi:MAG: class II aldolase/adducin family protein [Lachnospiraceae bacterium]|nr:class II aldolase/adducin family protein [Lachnospiraceae bacterium]
MDQYMNETEARKAIAEIGKRVYQNGYVGANDGNISCRIQENRIIVTPTGVSKGFMTEEMMVIMKLDGTVIGSGRPSSEIKMHLRAYQDNPDINGVIHVHPPISTACSVIGMALDQPLVAEGVLVTGNIPIANYAKPGSQQVPESIAPYLKEYHGALLERHGAITWGKDVYQALYRMEAMEHQAKIMLYTCLLSYLTGKTANKFSKEELDDLIQIRKDMGISTGGRPSL